MTDRLIVDVGMHRGDDTDFYLRKGFRVVAIEADPRLTAEAELRFSAAIAEGRLVVLNVAVAEEPGEVDFYASSIEGWGSIRAERAGSALGADVERLRVPSDTFAGLLSPFPVPYYVKVDIEGADRLCIESLCGMEHRPELVSFEADVSDPTGTEDLIELLSQSGYRDFKLVNQALNPSVRCPFPALEGRYVDARFTHEMSGPFGREAPGEWQRAEAISQRLIEIGRQQRARATYAESGRILGLPLGRFHRQVKAVYNLPPVVAVRQRYAQARGRDMGGWFDVHARLGSVETE
ncbi:FkbM family methyltransferase [Nocardioides sp. GCM10027113]|uniref:FkbM family methyltransferase n=1 Tax=unclassified Nocardioides TaxID=2615069 RepID=UPI003623B1D4